MEHQRESTDSNVPNTRVQFVRSEWVESEIRDLKKKLFPPKAPAWKRAVTWFINRVLPLLATIGLALYGYSFTRTEDRINTQRQIQKDSIQESIDNKISDYAVVAKALTNIRGKLNEILLKCSEKPQLASTKAFISEANMQRLNARIQLMESSFTIWYSFGDDISKQITSFDEWDEQISNVCEKAQSIDEEYRKRELKILSDMKTVIQNEQVKLEKIPLDDEG